MRNQIFFDFTDEPDPPPEPVVPAVEITAQEDIPAMYRKNLLPRVNDVVTQLQLMQLKPDTTKMRALIKKLSKLGFDTGCAEETIDEYAITPWRLEEERQELLDRLFANMATIIEDYEYEWRGIHGEGPQLDECEDSLIYSRWSEVRNKVRLVQANWQSQKTNYFIYRLSNTVFTPIDGEDDAQYIAFESEAAELARYYDLKMELIEGVVAVKIPHDILREMERRFRVDIVRSREHEEALR